MGILTAATHNVKDSQALLTTALDISAARHMSLEAVVKSLAKAQMGNVAGLARLGLQTKENIDREGIAAIATKVATKCHVDQATALKAVEMGMAGNSSGLEKLGYTTKITTTQAMSFTEIMKTANQTYGGAAQAALGTTAGKAAQMKETFSQLSDKLGAAVLPTINAVVSAIMSLVTWFENLSPSMKTAVEIIGGTLVAGIVAVTVANSGFVASLAALNVATGGILIAIGAVVTIVVLMLTHWKEAKQVAEDVWRSIRQAFEVCWHAIDAAFHAVWDPLKTAMTTTLSGLRDTWKVIWQTIGDVVHTVYDDSIGWLLNKLDVAWSAIKTSLLWFKVNVWKPVWQDIGDALQTIYDVTIKPVVDLLKDAWKAMKSVYNFFSGSGGGGTGSSSAGKGPGGKTGAGSEGDQLLAGMQGGGGTGVVDYARKFLGAPYRVGGTDPKTGIDCSGFAQLVYRHNGLPDFPDYTGNQDTMGSKVADSSQKGAAGMLQAGDLVFLRTGDPRYTDQRGFGHVGIYEGNGKVISATGHARGVAEDPISAWGSWEGRRYAGIGGSPHVAGGVLTALANAISGLAPLALYDQGGFLPPGVSIAVNNTGRSERVLGPGQGGGTVNNYSYNLTIHSSAPVEPIVHDFQMMKTMSVRGT
jgi:cell wall-associated NlpC family hydrolase